MKRQIHKTTWDDDRPVMLARALAFERRSAIWQAPALRRALAALLDVIFALPLTLLCAVAYVHWYLNTLEVSTQLAWYDYTSVALASHFGRVLGFWTVVVGAFGIFRFLATAFFDRTPGMALLRINYTTGAHRPPGPLRMCLREWLAIVSLTLFGAGWLWAIFDEAHRSLPDVISGIYQIPMETN